MSTRPLSPHLQVYRWQITMIMSTLHRLTGFVLAFALLILVWWLAAAATGPDSLNTVNGFLTSWFGKLCLVGFAFSAWYHLCNGIRHLAWDLGYGFEIPVLTKTGIAVLVAATILTLITVV